MDLYSWRPCPAELIGARIDRENVGNFRRPNPSYRLLWVGEALQKGDEYIEWFSADWAKCPDEWAGTVLCPDNVGRFRRIKTDAGSEVAT